LGCRAMSADRPIVIEDDDDSVADGLLKTLEPYKLKDTDDLLEEVGRIRDVFENMKGDKPGDKPVPVEIEQKSAACYEMRFLVDQKQLARILMLFPKRVAVAWDTEYAAKTEKNATGETVIVTVKNKNGQSTPLSSTSGAFLMFGVDVVELIRDTRTNGSDLVNMCVRVTRHVLIPANTQFTPEELKNYFLTQETVRELCQGDETQMATVLSIYPNAKDPRRTFHKVDLSLPEIKTMTAVLDYCRDKKVPTAGFTTKPEAEGKRIGAHLRTEPPQGIDVMKLGSRMIESSAKNISLEKVGKWLGFNKLDYDYPFEDENNCPTAVILRTDRRNGNHDWWNEMKVYCLRDVAIVTVLLAVAIKSNLNVLEECMPGGSASEQGAAKRRKT